MFKKLINRIRGARVEDLNMKEFTLQHCVEGVCALGSQARERYDEKTLRTAMAQTLLIPVNKQRELRNLPALDVDHFSNLYDQANGSMEVLAHLIYETAIGHR
jgi:hypothetical protein